MLLPPDAHGDELDAHRLGRSSSSLCEIAFSKIRHDGQILLLLPRLRVSFTERMINGLSPRPAGPEPFQAQVLTTFARHPCQGWLQLARVPHQLARAPRLYLLKLSLRVRESRPVRFILSGIVSGAVAGQACGRAERPAGLQNPPGHSVIGHAKGRHQCAVYAMYFIFIFG